MAGLVAEGMAPLFAPLFAPPLAPSLPSLLDQPPGVGRLLAFSTAADAAGSLPFGWDIATLQRGALIYLGVSSLAFVLVWVIGYLRRVG